MQAEESKLRLSGITSTPVPEHSSKMQHKRDGEERGEGERGGRRLASDIWGHMGSTLTQKKAKGKHNLGDSNLSEEMKESGEHIKGKQQDNFVGTTKNDHKRDWKTLAMATKNVPVEVEVIETKSNNLGNKRRNNGNRTRQDNGGIKQRKQQHSFVGTTKDDHVDHSELESSKFPDPGNKDGKQPNSFVGTTKNGHVDHSKLESSNFPDLGLEEELRNSSLFTPSLRDCVTFTVLLIWTPSQVLWMFCRIAQNTADQDALGDEVYMCDQYVANMDSEMAENTSDSVWADISGKQQHSFVGTTKDDHVDHSELESSKFPDPGNKDELQALALPTKDILEEVEVVETKSNNFVNKITRGQNGAILISINAIWFGQEVEEVNEGAQHLDNRALVGTEEIAQCEPRELDGLEEGPSFAVEAQHLDGLCMVLKGKQPNSFVGTTKNGHVDHSKLESSNFPDLGLEEELRNSSLFTPSLRDCVTFTVLLIWTPSQVLWMFCRIAQNTADQDALGDEVYMCDQYVANMDSEMAENTSDSVWADISGYSSCSGPSKR
uniref:Uncharacterized protein n=1 Tax=Oryza barthii TaxID=65489 RepID=A0A0D3H4I2_9ORYZ